MRFIRIARFRTSREPLAGNPNAPVKYLQLWGVGEDERFYVPQGFKVSLESNAPLYPVGTKGPLRPLPDGVPHRVVDAWRDLRVWGGVDVEVGGLRPPAEELRSLGICHSMR